MILEPATVELFVRVPIEMLGVCTKPAALEAKEALDASSAFEAWDEVPVKSPVKDPVNDPVILELATEPVLFKFRAIILLLDDNELRRYRPIPKGLVASVHATPCEALTNDNLPSSPSTIKEPEIAADPVKGKAVLGTLANPEPSPVNDPVNEPVMLDSTGLQSLNILATVKVLFTVLPLRSPEKVTGPTKFNPS